MFLLINLRKSLIQLWRVLFWTSDWSSRFFLHQSYWQKHLYLTFKKYLNQIRNSVKSLIYLNYYFMKMHFHMICIKVVQMNFLSPRKQAHIGSEGLPTHSHTMSDIWGIQQWQTWEGPSAVQRNVEMVPVGTIPLLDIPIAAIWNGGPSPGSSPAHCCCSCMASAMATSFLCKECQALSFSSLFLPALKPLSKYLPFTYYTQDTQVHM